jgi:hypothetical protein
MDNFLLIVSCSQRKNDSCGLMPAINRYDGPYYQSLRKLMVSSKMPRNLDIKIISAKYGLLNANDNIENYDLRMTADIARALHPQIIRGLKCVIDSKPYSEVYVNLGKDYLPAIDGFEKIIDRPIVFATGGIGVKRKQMIDWIVSHNSK